MGTESADMGADGVPVDPAELLVAEFYLTAE